MNTFLKLFFSLAIVFSIVGYVVAPNLNEVQQVFAQTKEFSTEELAKFDGKNGNKAYYAYEGKVYDVTGSKLWEEGEHFGLQAGTDLTGKMGDAPHGTDVFFGFEVVGSYGGTKTETAPATSTLETLRQENTPEMVKQEIGWYEKRIRPFGISILGWTGIALGIFFVFTFATCFALPWAKMRVPWAGNKPGPDPLDASGTHLTWSSVHKYFVWFTVVLGIVHGMIGFLQFFGVYL